MKTICTTIARFLRFCGLLPKKQEERITETLEVPTPQESNPVVVVSEKFPPVRIDLGHIPYIPTTGTVFNNGLPCTFSLLVLEHLNLRPGQQISDIIRNECLALDLALYCGDADLLRGVFEKEAPDTRREEFRIHRYRQF
jgi:hypothetical protein